MKKNIFKFCNEKEFYKRFPINDYSEFTRIVIYFEKILTNLKSDKITLKNVLLKFLNNKPYLLLEHIFFKKNSDTLGNEFIEIFGFCYSNSSLSDMDAELIEASEEIEGLRIQVLDYDNNLWQSYLEGDYDSGMQCANWDISNEDNYDYINLIKKEIDRLPMKFN